MVKRTTCINSGPTAMPLHSLAKQATNFWGISTTHPCSNSHSTFATGCRQRPSHLTMARLFPLSPVQLPKWLHMTFLHIISEWCKNKKKSIRKPQWKPQWPYGWKTVGNKRRAGNWKGKREQVPSPGYYERKEACSATWRSDAAWEKGLGQQTLGYAGTQ